MAISVVGSTAGAINNGNNVTLTFPTTTKPGDVVYVYGGHFIRSATSTDVGPTVASSYTAIRVSASATSSNVRFGLWRRILTAAEASVVCLGGGNTADAVAYGCFVVRGANSTGTPESTTSIAASTTANPNPPALTVDRENMVVAMSFSLVNDAAPGTVTSSSGFVYIDLGSAAATDTNPASVAASYTLMAATSGSQDPGAWSAWSAGSNASITLAVVPKPVPLFEGEDNSVNVVRERRLFEIVGY